MQPVEILEDVSYFIGSDLGVRKGDNKIRVD